jgi:hypothetical protein
MADQTNGLGFRKLEATTMAAMYYFATLHGSGGSALVASTLDVYAASGLGELTTANGYTVGGAALGQGTVNANTNVDTADAVWTAATAPLVASYCALWCNTTNTITGAKFIQCNDQSATPQTASVGQTMTWPLVNPIQY